MAQFYIIPSWFFGFDFALEIIFGLITLAVSIYSFKVYKYCLEKKCRLFGWGFLSLAISYFIWATVSLYVSQNINSSQGVVFLTDFTKIIALGVYGHAFFFLIGLVTLAYMTFGIKNQRVYTLLASIVIITLIFSAQKIIAFYFLASLLLFYVIVYYAVEMLNGRKNVLVILSFVFLFLGSVDFTLSAVNNIHYVIGHVLFLIGYLIILANFILMLKPVTKMRGKK